MNFLVVLALVCAALLIAYLAFINCVMVKYARKLRSINDRLSSGDGTLAHLKEMHEAYELLEGDLLRSGIKKPKPFAFPYHEIASRAGHYDYSLRLKISSLEFRQEIKACQQKYADNPMAQFTALLSIKDKCRHWRYDSDEYQAAIERVLVDQIVPLAKSGNEEANQFVLDNLEKVL